MQGSHRLFGRLTLGRPTCSDNGSTSASASADLKGLASVDAAAFLGANRSSGCGGTACSAFRDSPTSPSMATPLRWLPLHSASELAKSPPTQASLRLQHWKARAPRRTPLAHSAATIPTPVATLAMSFTAPATRLIVTSTLPCLRSNTYRCAETLAPHRHRSPITCPCQTHHA
jgi:hypothetical protein